MMAFFFYLTAGRRTVERERVTRGLLGPVRGAKLRGVEWKVRVMQLLFDRSIGLEAS